MDGSITSNQINTSLVKGETKDRIYDAEIKLFKFAESDADKYKNMVYKISSATENSN
jgi:hypothetical protein